MPLPIFDFYSNMKFRIPKLKGALRSKLMHLTWPIFIEISLIMLLGIGDVFMLGGYSDYAVGAVGVVNQIINMVFLLFGVVTTGTSVLVARYLGERNNEAVKAIVSVSLLLNIVIGIVISLSMWLMVDPILQLMGIRQEMYADALIYMRIVGAFAFLQALSFTLSAVMRSLQRPKYPMMGILVVNIVNVIGNYLLIYGHCGCPELGTQGAAIATVTSRFVVVVILSFSLFRIVMKDLSVYDLLQIKWARMKEVLAIGIPSAGEQLSYALSQVVATYWINMVSNEAVIARAYVANIVMVSYLLAYAMSQSCSITVGYLVGERRLLAAHRLTLFCTRLTIFVGIIIGIILASNGQNIVGLFSDNAEVLALTSVVMWIDVLLEIGRALNMIVIQALRAAGDYIFPVAFGALSVWGISVGVSYVFGITCGLGLAGIWFAFALDEQFRGWVMLHRFNMRKWGLKINR